MVDNQKGWQVTDVHDIPPSKSIFMAGWHSVRWHFGITGFGVNAVTKDSGDIPIPEHDEAGTDQQELFFVAEGEAEFTLDGETILASAGTFVAVEPHVSRSAKVLIGPATIIIIGGKAKNHSVAPWDN